MKSTKPQTLSVTKRDFDKAVAAPWDATKCIVAQAMLRNRIPVEKDDDVYRFAIGNGLRDVQRKFDLEFNRPGDEEVVQLKELRRILPIKVVLSCK